MADTDAAGQQHQQNEAESNADQPDADQSDGQAATSPKLEHLQQTIDDAKDAAKAALSDQPDV